MKDNKLKIALLLGGTSPERKVSKSSGLSIYKALTTLGYETIPVDPAYGENQPKDIEAFFTEKDFAEISNENYIKALNMKLFDSIDLAFLALHGKWGEDGTLQSLLELKGIKYTGSKVLSSAITMDKAMSKILFQHYGIRTPKWTTVSDKNYNLSSVINETKTEVKFPCVIKPNDQGSTVGLTICENESSVDEAIKLALQFSDKVLIEEYIKGRELTVGILEDKALPVGVHIFPVLEIKPKHGIYDYECKYTPGMSEYEVPAKISNELSDKLKKISVAAFKALCCEGYARADFILNENNVDYCLEVNTLPGMTSTSLVPKVAKAAGISFEEIIGRIIKTSLSSG